MRNKLLVTTILLGAGAGTAYAAPPVTSPMPMLGSDTLFTLTRDLLTAANLGGTACSGGTDCACSYNSRSPGAACTTDDQCPGLRSSSPGGCETVIPAIRYDGTGSGAGGNAMNPALAGAGGIANQQIASQSRFLSATECNFIGSGAGTGRQLALDGIGMWRDATEGSACKVLRYTGCLTIEERNAPSLTGLTNSPASATLIDDGANPPVALADDDAAAPGVQYCFEHWADALRIIYAGYGATAATKHASTSPGALTPTGACAASPSASDRAQRRCNSDLRHTLVAQWGNMFDDVPGVGDGGCVDSNCPSGLKHAWRRDDFSGTTDTFLTLIGAPAVAPTIARTFCNGIENEDLDPVRRNCDAAANALTGEFDTACSAVPMRLRNLAFGVDGNPSGAANNNVVSAVPTNVCSNAPERACANAAVDCPAGTPAPTCVGQARGDLGLVQAITIPATQVFDDRIVGQPPILITSRRCVAPSPAANLNQPCTDNAHCGAGGVCGPAQAYNPQYDTFLCTAAAVGGNFKLAPMPFAALTNMQRCPNGNPRANNRCQWPTQRTTLPVAGNPANPEANWFNCRVTRTNRQGPANWAGYDARAYNAWPRNPITGNILQPNATQITDPRFTVQGIYRKHMVSSAANRANHPACRELDSTDQIGCLVEADPCTVGFAGLSAEDDLATDYGTVSTADNEALFLRTPLSTGPAVQPTTTDIEQLTKTCGTGFELRYPLARTLWLNSSKGITAVTNTVATPAGAATTRECDFVNFVATPANINPLVLSNGFIPLPATAPIHYGCDPLNPGTPIALGTAPTCTP